MMTNLEYIDSYFKAELSAEEIIDFDQKIISDHDFAEEVFLYCSTIRLCREELAAERKERFRQLYKGSKGKKEHGLIRKWWPYIAAAAVVAGVIFAGLEYFKPSSLQEKADHYISQHLQVVGVQMSGAADSLQTAKQLYNENRLTESLQLLENILLTNTQSDEAKKIAGSVSLRLGKYDKAVAYFLALEKMQLFANPGKFYHALTLLKRNLPGDRESAISLLKQVVDEKLEGKETAANWLENL